MEDLINFTPDRDCPDDDPFPWVKVGTAWLEMLYGLVTALRIPGDSAHNAKVDSQNTYLLWRKLMDNQDINHLPHHKTFVHSIKKDEDLDDIDGLDISLLQ